MSLVVKIIIWIGIGILAWLGIPLLLKSLFGLVGLAVLIVKWILNVALLALIAGIILYLWRRVRSA